MINHIETIKQLKENYSIDEYLELLLAMADKTRQEIITLFASQKEICANDIAKNFVLSRPTISHHLNLMKRAKLLNARKVGKIVYYSFNKSYVIKLMDSILNCIKNSC